MLYLFPMRGSVPSLIPDTVEMEVISLVLLSKEEVPLENASPFEEPAIASSKEALLLGTLILELLLLLSCLDKSAQLQRPSFLCLL